VEIDGWQEVSSLLAVNLVGNGVEDVTGTAFDDILIGDARDNTLLGGAGADGLLGGLGRDRVLGQQVGSPQ
jgi:Ca2+-binding RTX toxin-like protein